MERLGARDCDSAVQVCYFLLGFCAMKDELIHVRIPNAIYRKLKTIASGENRSVPNLATVVLTKFAEGKLVELPAKQ